MKYTNPSRTVYSYYFQETRNIIDKLTEKYPHEVFLGAIDGGLDDFHEKVLDGFVSYAHKQIKGLGTFEYRYVSGGASEGIFHVLADIAANNKNVPLYVLEGEYEGYEGYGENLGLSFTKVAIDYDFARLTPGMFFISNPSARNGNLLPQELVTRVGEAGHKVMLDITYLGLTIPFDFDVTPEYIDTVFFSISKPFGVYYHRIGFCFSRKKYNTLWVNKWFKNLFSQILAKKLFDTYQASDLYKKYEQWQQRAVKELSKRYGLNIKQSDVVLLAYIACSEVSQEKHKELAEFKRGEYYRFCLTPFYLEYEKNN